MLKTDSITEISAVHNLHTLKVSCVMLEKISDITETSAVHNLHT